MKGVKRKTAFLSSMFIVAEFAFLDYSIACGTGDNFYPKSPISDYTTITSKVSTNDPPTYQITKTDINEPTPSKIIVENSTESVDYATIINLEFTPFKFKYDGSKFERVYPDLPKAQHALRHKETGIEILFKGLLIDGSVDEIIQNMDEDLQTLFIQVDKQYNSEQGWYQVTALNKHTNQYWVMKKWFVPDLTESVTVEMTVHIKDLDNALAIMTHFEHQNYPYVF